MEIVKMTKTQIVVTEDDGEIIRYHKHKDGSFYPSKQSLRSGCLTRQAVLQSLIDHLLSEDVAAVEENKAARKEFNKYPTRMLKPYCGLFPAREEQTEKRTTSEWRDKINDLLHADFCRHWCAPSQSLGNDVITLIGRNGDKWLALLWDEDNYTTEITINDCDVNPHDWY